MLVTRRGEGLACVAQYDHGMLAGALAERWGNERFEAPRPRDPLVRAAARHDDGWHALDDVPVINATARRPAHFLEIPSEQTIAAHAGGVESVYAADPYAGILVGMHWSGLYSARWGLADSAPAQTPITRAAATEAERRWRATALEVWGFRGSRGEFESRLWHSYEILQALDLLSLFLSLIDLGAPSEPGVAATPITATLGEIEQRPGPRIVPAVPTTRHSGHVPLLVGVLEAGVVSVTPFPFAGGAVTVEVPVRRLEHASYPSVHEAAEAYLAATPAALPCTLVDDPLPQSDALSTP